jgi:hypothetical protein
MCLSRGFDGRIGLRIATTLFGLSLCLAIWPRVSYAGQTMVGTTGFMRLVETSDSSWFIAPTGSKFFSLGVDCVDQGEDQSEFKASNPSYASYQYYSSPAAWESDTLARLHSWGFNSLGAWSGDLIQSSGMPYTLELEFGGSNHVPWSDLFDPAMQKSFDDLAAKEVAPVSRDPNLIGYFTDNEIGWWDDTLFTYFLESKPDNNTRHVLMRLLRSHYHGSFAALQADWDPIDVGSFDALDRGGDLKLRPGGNGRVVMDQFIYLLASRYYKLAHDAVRRYDTNHLILGDRYCGWYSRPVARAAAPYVDVISTNYGSDWTDGHNARFYFDSLHKLTGKPILVTEFYFCANENSSGNKNTSAGFPTVQTQSERAKGFRTDLASIASLPYVVGAHWFQYYDEPQNGRGDGENYDMGLVDIHNQPYEGMIQAVQSLDVPKIHALGAIDCVPQSLGRAKDRVAVPPAPTQPMVGLTNWTKSPGFVVPSGAGDPAFADLYACWDTGTLYLGIQTMDYREPNLYAGGVVPNSEQLHLQIKIGDSDPITVVATSGTDKAQTAKAGLPTISSGAATVSEIESGIRSAVMVAIPAALLNKQAFQSGENIPISATLVNHGRLESMGWTAEFQLAAPNETQ